MKKGFYKDGKKWTYYYACGKEKEVASPNFYCSIECQCFRTQKSFRHNNTIYYTRCCKCNYEFIPLRKHQYCKDCQPISSKSKNYELYKEKQYINYHSQRKETIIKFMTKIEKRNYFVSTEEIFDLLELWETLPREQKSSIDELQPKKQIEVAFKELKLFYEANKGLVEKTS